MQQPSTWQSVKKILLVTDIWQKGNTVVVNRSTWMVILSFIHKRGVEFWPIKELNFSSLISGFLKMGILLAKIESPSPGIFQRNNSILIWYSQTVPNKICLKNSSVFSLTHYFELDFKRFQISQHGKISLGYANTLSFKLKHFMIKEIQLVLIFLWLFQVVDLNKKNWNDEVNSF